MRLLHQYLPLIYPRQARVQFHDANLPSGNGLQVQNFLKLVQYTGDFTYQDKALEVLKRVSGYLLYQPLSAYFHLNNLIDFYDNKTSALYVFVFSDQLSSDKQKLLKQSFYLNQRSHPLGYFLSHSSLKAMERPKYLQSKEILSEEKDYLMLFRGHKLEECIEGVDAIQERLELGVC